MPSIFSLGNEYIGGEEEVCEADPRLGGGPRAYMPSLLPTRPSAKEIVDVVYRDSSDETSGRNTASESEGDVFGSTNASDPATGSLHLPSARSSWPSLRRRSATDEEGTSDARPYDPSSRYDSQGF
ncbi:hypothetical protein IAR55_005313 [Kwoniella newhampshirensis]|uniref:Uncharacterized protein n=1 Tax=Kwoniella newhampshirensis TaxID=1651941 RepID=A0AAW0YH52_9TREE